jgi:flagellar biosynthesis protein FliR
VISSMALSLLLTNIEKIIPIESIRCFVAFLVIPLPIPQWTRMFIAMSTGFLVSSWEYSLWELGVEQIIQELVYGCFIVIPFALVVQGIRYAGEFFDSFRGHSLGRIVAPFDQGSQGARGIFSLLLEYGALGLLASSGLLCILYATLVGSFEVFPIVQNQASPFSHDFLTFALSNTVKTLAYIFVVISPLGAIFLGVDLVFGIGSLLVGKVPLQNEASQVKNIMIVLLTVALFSQDSALASTARSLGNATLQPIVLLEEIHQLIVQTK